MQIAGVTSEAVASHHHSGPCGVSVGATRGFSMAWARVIGEAEVGQ
jgi:hypothetical protein